MSERSSIALLKKASVSRKKSVRVDKKEFNERVGDGSGGWVESKQITRCTLCDAKFTMTKRKHHCRECGKVFCASCSSYKLVVNGEMKRSCMTCYRKKVGADDEEKTLVLDAGQSLAADIEGSKQMVRSGGLSPMGSEASSSPAPPASIAAASTSVSTHYSEKKGDEVGSKLPPWADAFVYVRRVRGQEDSDAAAQDSSQAQNALPQDRDSREGIRVVFPQDNIPADVLGDICRAAIPQHAQGGGTDALSTKFLFRVRSKQQQSNSSSSAEGFYNCFVFYKQELQQARRNSMTGGSKKKQQQAHMQTSPPQLLQQAFVVVSRWPFLQLGFRLAVKLEEAVLLYRDVEAGSAPASRATSAADQPSAAAASLSAAAVPGDAGAPASQPGSGSAAGSPSPTQWKEFDKEGAELSGGEGAGGPEDGDAESEDEDEEFGDASTGEGAAAKSDRFVVTSVMMTAYSQLAQWPEVSSGAQMYLHFLGEMLQIKVPIDILLRPSAAISAGSGSSSSSSNKAPEVNFAAALSGINLISLFAPMGLVQHLWVLWELLISGQDIVVVASSPAQCSEVVLALASLVLPLASQVVDARPYLHADDAELQTLAAASRAKQQLQRGLQQGQVSSGSKTLVVGVTDMAALRELDCFGAVLLVAPTSHVGELADPDSTFKGLRTKNAAYCYRMGEGPAAAAAGAPRRGSFSGGVRGSDVALTFCNYFSTWLEGGSARSMLVHRQGDNSFSLSKLLVKIKKMHPKDRAILGDMLLRDNLRAITQAFFQPALDKSAAAVAASASASTATVTADGAEEAGGRPSDASTYGGARKDAAPRASLLTHLFGELRQWLGAHPAWLLHNVPTVILWTCYAIVFLLAYAVGIPPVALIGIAFIVKIPDRATPAFESILQDLFPESILYPARAFAKANASNKSKSGGAAASAGASSGASAAGGASATGDGAEAGEGKRVDLSGVWKRGKMVNYENFIAAQGASYVQRKLATSINMTHTITMSKDLSAFRLQEKGGPINTDNTYSVDGPPVMSKMSTSEHRDTIQWEGGRLLMRKVRLPEDKHGYEVLVYRRLLEGTGEGKQIELYSKVMDVKGNKGMIVDTTVMYDYQGPSPNPALPDSEKTSAAQPEGAATGTSAAAGGAGDDSATAFRDMSGVWQRTKSVNLEAVFGAMGAGFMQRKLAASMALTHTLTIDAPSCTAFRLQEKGGPINTDVTLTLGADFTEAVLQGNKTRQRAFLDGDALVLHRIMYEKNMELFLTRSWADDDSGADGKQLVLKFQHRHLGTGKEVEATSWFSYTGPSPNPPPQPDAAAMKQIAATAAAGGEDHEEQQASATTGDATDAGKSSAVLLARTPSRQPGYRSRLRSGAAHVDNDDDDDDDDTAVSKMRNSFRTPLSPIMMNSSVPGSIGSPFPAGQKQQESRPDFSGKWQRDLGIGGKQLTHEFFLSKTSLRLRELDARGRVLEDVNLLIDDGGDGGSDGDGEEQQFVQSRYQGKVVRSRCYFEGATLVVHRICAADGIELFFKRDLEQQGDGGGGAAGPVIRLVTEQRSLNTGETSETMAIFKKAK